MTDAANDDMRAKRRRQLYLQMRIEELQKELQTLRDERVALSKELGGAKNA